MSITRTQSKGVSRQRLERLEKIVAIADGLVPMFDVIRASAPPHVSKASGETSNLAFPAALIIAIDWQGISSSRDHFYSWHVIIGGAPNANLYLPRSDEEFSAEAAASTPVSEFIACDSKCNK
jgi:hypothetical protein